MKKREPLHYKLLCQKLDPKELGFDTTAQLKSIKEFVGQERALAAIYFGLGIKSHGYNLYAMGPSGLGKRSLIRTILRKEAAKQKVPSDWCYLYNFENPEKPIALELPAGLGVTFKKDMTNFLTKLGTGILAMLESDEYQRQMNKIKEDVKPKKKYGFTKIVTLKKHKMEHALQAKLTAAIVNPYIKKLADKYAKQTNVMKHLLDMRKDIITHASEFIKIDETTNESSFAPESSLLLKYQVNLFVDNSKRKGAPIIFSYNPSYSNLICRVEYAPEFGTLITNFTLIKSGALHRANGGYLILEARKVKKADFAWEGLKRALYARKIQIEPIEHLTDTARQVSIEPLPIPLDVKVILLGSRTSFYSLCNTDPEFLELFKVAADFDEQIERKKSNIILYARLIGSLAKRKGLRNFSASAVAVIIDHSTRLAEDTRKLSAHIQSLTNMIEEADYWAGLQKKKIVEVVDVKRAIAEHTHRRDRSRESYYEEITRDFILINTMGESVGQVNCLSVVKVGNFTYGHPTRLTAKVRAGKDQFIDIQREIKLAGPILTKGGLIIANFLASRYNLDHTFSLTASLAFEQIYGVMDGDSASVAEICALLSALGEIPIKQYLAITGSVNQQGDVQAIGGVNDKIEGFFDICNARGLTGKQGVLIPAVNAKNLMLREDLVKAAKEKKFAIYLIETVDEAISILTDLPAGKRYADGRFQKNSINDLVEKRLIKFSKNRFRKT